MKFNELKLPASDDMDSLQVGLLARARSREKLVRRFGRLMVLADVIAVLLLVLLVVWWFK